MKRISIDIELLDDAILTAKNATIGAPESLDVLPGATLLGAAAARSYATWDEAFQVFQLGAVSFGDGAPVTGDQAAVPKPLSWHRQKVRAEGSEKPPPGRLLDLSQQARPTEGQWDQLRGGFLIEKSGNEWQELDLKKNTSMRTAMDEGARARDGFLYGFEAVPRGTCYRAVIQGRDASLVDRAVYLLQQAPFRVGRSRNAEFGRAKVVAAGEVRPMACGRTQHDIVRILLTSDLALIDPTTGAPRLVPTGADFGLNGSLDLSRSFLRTRRYSPFHGTRQRFDVERQVLIAGSVLTFQAGEVDLGRLQTRCNEGVGLYTGAGLGRGLVEPDVLRAPEPKLHSEKLTPTAAQRSTDATVPDPGLLAWMKASHESSMSELNDWAIATEQAARWAKYGIPKAQWGRVRAIAGSNPTPKALREALEAHLKDGKTADIWRKANHFLEWAKERDRTPRQVELVARLVPREMAKNDADQEARR